MNYFNIFMIFIVIGYIVFYIRGRIYLKDGFEQQRMTPATAAASASTAPSQKPYVTDPIQKLDDYEITAVFNNEGSKEASDAIISNKMDKYRRNWTQMPPSAQQFQDESYKYITSVQNNTSQSNAQIANAPIYAEIDGSNMTPPDLQAADDKERQVLAMYKPSKASDLLHYDIDDARDLVKKVYKEKGLNARVTKSKQGENVFEITDVTHIPPKIVWEDDFELQTERDKAVLKGEQVIEVPQTVNDLAAGLDPFFEPRTATRMNRNDYTTWTPGLERAFAPTNDDADWY